MQREVCSVQHELFSVQREVCSVQRELFRGTGHGKRPVQPGYDQLCCAVQCEECVVVQCEECVVV